MNTSPKHTDRPSPTDNLTTAQRKLLYDPARYTISQDADLVFHALHADVPAWFTAVKDNRSGVLHIQSNTGNEHTVDYINHACTCADSQERARVEQRPCKHYAVAMAVARYCDERRRAKAAAAAELEADRQAAYIAKCERNRRALCAVMEIAREARGRSI